MDLINRYRHTLIFLLLLALLYTPVFMHLDYMPIRVWDESFLGVHTYEMMENGNYIVTYNNGIAEMSNCKPPLAIWAMAACSKVLGFNVLSMRLPSAIAAVLLCIGLFYLLRRYTGSTMFALITVLVLITTRGYVRNHVIRTAEYDSILVLFSCLAALQLFFATEAEDEKKQGTHLLYFFIFLTLAVLNKGVAVMMMAPGLYVYVLLRRKLIAFLKNKYTYIGLGMFLIFGLGYYALHETITPGYLEAVWINELGGRYAQDISTHNNDGWLFYIYEIWQWQYAAYIALLPLGILAGLLFSDTKIRRLTQFCLVTGIWFLLVISSAATKLPHYDAPLFPFLAMLTAPLIYLVYIALKNHLANTQYMAATLVPVLIVLGIFGKPYIDICQSVLYPKGDMWEFPFSTACTYFRDAVHKRIPQPYRLTSSSMHVYAEEQVLRCYTYMLQTNKLGEGIVSPKSLNAGDTVILFDNSAADYLNGKYDIQWVENLPTYNANVVVLSNKKQAPQ